MDVLRHGEQDPAASASGYRNPGSDAVHSSHVADGGERANPGDERPTALQAVGGIRVQAQEDRGHSVWWDREQLRARVGCDDQGGEISSREGRGMTVENFTYCTRTS